MAPRVRPQHIHFKSFKFSLIRSDCTYLDMQRVCLPTKDAKSSWLSLRHCNTSGMILADPLASSRLQIELVIVESSVSPSLRKSHVLI
jgi:hypothetical protein